VPVGQCLMLAGRPGATQEGQQASFGQSGAALWALLTDPPQEVLDVCTMEDLGEIPDLEAEAYAYVGASTSLPDLAVGAAADVGATTSLAIGLTTTHTKLRSELDIDIGCAVGGDLAPAASEVPPNLSTQF